MLGETLQKYLPARALIVGCGDIGVRLAHQLQAYGCVVRGVIRSPSRSAALHALGIDPLLHDLDETSALTCDAPLVFYFAPPPQIGHRDLRMRQFLSQLDATKRVIYISTSGVYGDCAGRWIDEREPLKPSSERAQRRLDAERALAEWGGDHVILRVPGIYGPGRLPIERLQKKLPVVRDAESPFSNRIHADDLATAALHAAAYGRSSEAYNISDGQPTTMCDYFTRCAVLLDLPPPPQISLLDAQHQFTPAMWSFMEESKRLLTARMREQLRFAPRYASLAEGLPSCL